MPCMKYLKFRPVFSAGLLWFCALFASPLYAAEPMTLFSSANISALITCLFLAIMLLLLGHGANRVRLLMAGYGFLGAAVTIASHSLSLGMSTLAWASVPVALVLFLAAPFPNPQRALMPQSDLRHHLLAASLLCFAVAGSLMLVRYRSGLNPQWLLLAVMAMSVASLPLNWHRRLLRSGLLTLLLTSLFVLAWSWRQAPTAQLVSLITLVTAGVMLLGTVLHIYRLFLRLDNVNEQLVLANRMLQTGAADSVREQDTLVLRDRLQEVVIRAQAGFLTGNEADGYHALVNGARIMAGTAGAAVATISFDESGEPQFVERAASLMAEAGADHSWADQADRQGLALTSLAPWRQAARRGQAMLVNNPEADPRMSGLPDEVRSLKNCAAIPLSHDGRINGVLCLFDRDSGFSDALVESLTPLFTDSGRLIHARDAGPQRLLQDPVDQYQPALECLLDAVLMFDANTLQVMYANTRVAHQLGMEAAGLAGRSLFELAPQLDSHRLQQQLASLVDGSEALLVLETAMPDRSGSTVPVKLSIQYASPHHGKPYFVAVVRGAGEQKQLDQMKAEFLSMVSHELRTPLTAIHGALELMAGGVAGPVENEFGSLLGIARNNSERLQRLVDDIIELSGFESGRAKLDIRKTRLLAVLEASVMHWRRQALGEGKQLSLGAVPDISVLADPQRLAIVFDYLLSSAIRLAPVGKEVRMDALYDNGRVRVRIISDGQVLSAGLTKSEAGSQGVAENNGLGLGLCRAIIDYHGGNLGYEQENGRSHVWLELDAIEHQELHQPGRTRLLVCTPDVTARQRLAASLQADHVDIHSVESLVQLGGLSDLSVYDALVIDTRLWEDTHTIPGDLSALMGSRKVPTVVIAPPVMSSTERMAMNARGFARIVQSTNPHEQVVGLVRSVLPDTIEGRCILHVEDDDVMAEVLISLLHEDDVEITRATSLSQARQALSEKDFGLVVLDVGLPDGSGLDLLPVRNSKGDTLPVVLLSANDQLPVDASVLAVINKGNVSSEELRKQIRTAMGR